MGARRPRKNYFQTTNNRKNILKLQILPSKIFPKMVHNIKKNPIQTKQRQKNKKKNKIKFPKFFSHLKHSQTPKYIKKIRTQFPHRKQETSHP